MKVSNFAKAALTAMVVLGAVSAHAQSEGQGGNGGGLVQRDGRWMTFGSAGFNTEPVESTVEEVPQLTELLRFFNTTPYMSEMTKVKYASNLMPSSARTYYKVKPGTFTPAVRARLIEEYSRVMKIDAQKIAIAAITDTEKKTTYLFPEFFSLRPVEQKAILFHETFWLLNPKATYDQVVKAEMNFQAYLESPNSVERLTRWMLSAGTEGDLFTAAIKTDLASGVLAPLLQGGHMEKQMVNGKKMKVSVGGTLLSAQTLLGPQFAECVSRGVSVGECEAFFATNLYALSQQYPRSVFFRVAYDFVSRKAFYPMRKTSISDQVTLLPQVWIDLSKIGYSQEASLTASGEFRDSRYQGGIRHVAINFVFGSEYIDYGH